MKPKKLLTVIILIALTACENAFFKANDDVNSEADRTSKKEQELNGEGVAFYLIKDFDWQTDIDIDAIDLEEEPFISYDDIVAYDSSAHVFQLTTDASSFFLGDGNIDMKGFVLTVDDETILNGVLWSPIHSQVCSDVVLTLYIDNAVHGNLIELVAAYPSEKYASEQVNLNDSRLINRLAADNKLKSLVGEDEPGVDTDPFPYPESIDTMYYEHEIFNDAYTDIYGKWKLNEISGGLTGNGAELNFEYLIICKYGIYLFIDGDNLLEAGKIVIDEQSGEQLKISFSPDPSSSTFFYDAEKYVIFEGDNNERLILNSPCCDRYNYHFKREE